MRRIVILAAAAMLLTIPGDAVGDDDGSQGQHLRGDVIGTTRDTVVESLSGLSGVVALKDSTLTRTQDAASAAFASSMLQFQPVDPAIAPFSMAMFSQPNIDGTSDYVASWGFNASNERSGQAIATYQLENHYVLPQGDPVLEQYTQIVSNDGNNWVVHPFSAQFDKANGRSSVGVQFREPGGAFAVNNESATVLEVLSNTLYLPQDPYTIEAGGSVSIRANSYIALYPGSANNQVLIATDSASFRKASNNAETVRIEPSEATIVAVDPSVPGRLGTPDQPWDSAVVRHIAYTPATPTNWSGTAPTTVGEALDRIAAKLAQLGAAP